VFTLVSHACPFLNRSWTQPGPRAEPRVLLSAGVGAGSQGVPSPAGLALGCFAGEADPHVGGCRGSGAIGSPRAQPGLPGSSRCRWQLPGPERAGEGWGASRGAGRAGQCPLERSHVLVTRRTPRGHANRRRGDGSIVAGCGVQGAAGAVSVAAGVVGGTSWVPAAGGFGCWGGWWLHSPWPRRACWGEGGSAGCGTETVRRGHGQGQGSEERMQAGMAGTLLSHTGKRLPREPLLPLCAVGHRLGALQTPQRTQEGSDSAAPLQ